MRKSIEQDYELDSNRIGWLMLYIVYGYAVGIFRIKEEEYHL